MYSVPSYDLVFFLHHLLAAVGGGGEGLRHAAGAEPEADKDGGTRDNLLHDLVYPLPSSLDSRLIIELRRFRLGRRRHRHRHRLCR